MSINSFPIQTRVFDPASKQDKITTSGLLKGLGGGSIGTATAGTDYQVPLVSGTSIKTINGTSVLGSGDITITSGSSTNVVDTLTSTSTTDALSAAKGKALNDAKADVVHSHAAVTTSANGYMSAADKTKLDGIATSANNYTHPTSGVGAGTYKSVTVDANGHITAGTNPTTLAGYGITDASASSHTHTKSSVGLANVDNTSDANKPISSLTQTALDAKQATLVSGTNIKTINGTSVLGSGDITIAGGSSTTVNNTLTSDSTTEALSAAQGKVLQTTKQDTLVSGTSIKSINGISVLGSGNIEITGGSGSTLSITTAEFTATNGQTSFATTYSPPFLQVYVNGIKLPASDYVATDGGNITLGAGLATGDFVEVVKYTPFNTVQALTEKISATLANKGVALVNTLDYVSAIEIPFTGTITKLRARTATGTVSVRFKLNGVAIGSLIDANASGVDQVISQAVTQYDLITVDISSAAGNGLTVFMELQ